MKFGDLPRVYTKEEVQQDFLAHLLDICRYCERLQGKSCFEKLTLAVFSVLVVFDGEDGTLPAFDVVCRPHPDDEKYNRGEGDNWYPDGENIADGTLHEQWCRMT